MSLAVFNARSTLKTQSGSFIIHRLDSLEKLGITQLDLLPYSIRILLESVLRQVDGDSITEEHVLALSKWKPKSSERHEILFLPARVILQDITGIPTLVDLAAMRSALHRHGSDPKLISPKIPIDLVIDHSLQVEFFASPEAFRRNAEIEFNLNRERYEFLRWSVEAFNNFRVVPPATGILHQVNLEFLAGVVLSKQIHGQIEAYPDTLVGTDPHTTMINGLGVLGWDVGTIEATTTILGQPLLLSLPEIIGFRFKGNLNEGVTATDLALTVTQILKDHGVNGKFVEFLGSGLSELSLPDRAMIANMAPEYGAKVGFFPVDEETLHYLQSTGRSDESVDLVERYCKEQGLYRTKDSPDPIYSEILELDLGTVVTCLSGPNRTQDRIPLEEMKSVFQRALITPSIEGGFEIEQNKIGRVVVLRSNGNQVEIGHGAVVIAAITSCTNTSNPSVMVGAGLFGKKALEKGLRVKPYVKTSLAPGSRVVVEYLREGGLLQPLASLGFNVVGFGCATCIGNSGPLPAEVIKAINQENLIVSAVISGNRNFEGFIHPHVRANYLASPALVVAYAIAGTTNIDLSKDPLGMDSKGHPIYLSELWPTQEEIQSIIDCSLSPETFRNRYRNVFTENESWNDIPVPDSTIYPWDPRSTYIQEPPYFEGITDDLQAIEEIIGARVLVLLGDAVPTEHISPSGPISVESPAGQFLIQCGIHPRNFHSFDARCGNDRVMTRNTFGCPQLKNLLIPKIEGGITIHLPDNERMNIYEAAMKYRQEDVPIIIVAGTEYGCGSHHDWAAKGTSLLGVRAVLAKSFEENHRFNLIGMGVMPLQFRVGEDLIAFELSGHEIFDILDLDDSLESGSPVRIRATKNNGSTIEFKALARIDTPAEIKYYRNGGILKTAFRQALQRPH